MRSVPGEQLCFTMSVTDEVELVRDRVARLSRVHRGCRIVLLADGRSAARRSWPSGPNVSIRGCAKRLYGVENGGRVVQRHLEVFLESGASWWFKVDPDTVAWRRFRDLPLTTCFFGTIQGGNPGRSLQGGCIGGTRDAAEELVASSLLLSPVLLDPEATWASGNPFLIARALAGLVSFDFLLAWACRQAGIPLVAHPEIRSEWKQPPLDPSQYAITHPHKKLDLEAEARAIRSRRRVAARLARLIRERVPLGATIAVASKGDIRLTAVGLRHARHFPADDSGSWAGFHPADSAHAIALLEDERAAGVDHFALPETGDWWLEFYGGFAEYLASSHRLVVHAPGAGRIWALGRT